MLLSARHFTYDEELLLGGESLKFKEFLLQAPKSAIHDTENICILIFCGFAEKNHF
jgi:hypothetical protein